MLFLFVAQIAIDYQKPAYNVSAVTDVTFMLCVKTKDVCTLTADGELIIWTETECEAGAK